MINFTDLCNAFSQALDKFNVYLENCEKLAVDIWNEMLEYHQIPVTQIGLYTFNDSGVSEKVNGPMSISMKLQEDSFFEFGIGHTLYAKENEMPCETIVIPVRVSQDGDGKYKAKMGEEGKIFSIDRAVKTDLQNFTDNMLTSVMDQYKNGLSKMINQNTIRKVGFSIN